MPVIPVFHIVFIGIIIDLRVIQFPTLSFRLRGHGSYYLYRHNSMIRSMEHCQNLLTQSETACFLLLGTARLMTTMRISG